MRTSAQALTTAVSREMIDEKATPYRLTLAALTYSWLSHAPYNVAVGLAFAWAGGPLLALSWTLSLCATDFVLQRVYSRMTLEADTVGSDAGLTRLSWLALVKGLAWYGVPTAFTVLNHSLAGLAFVAIQTVGLTALAVSTARNSRRVYYGMVATSVVALPLCIVSTLGLANGAGALCESVLLAFALWVIGAGTSRVVAEWNESNTRRLQALADMREALARSEIAEARLGEALERAEQSGRAKDEFLAVMSHEIRTPLNGVLGMTQALARGDLSDVQRGHLQMISTAGESLMTILNDLLDLSKIGAGRIELEDGVIDAEALGASAGTFAPLLQDKDVLLSVTVAPQARGHWSGDPTRVRQVLNNLVSNAVKFTDHGTIRVDITHDGEALILAVEDTGMGISPERLSQVFEPFVQADASTTRRFGGSGLGLTICRDLVALMGGTIDLVSREGEGSKFTLRLPARAVAAPAAADETGAAVIAFDGLRILVAEDNFTNQIVLRTLLEASGIYPEIVANGEEAVAAWTSGRWDAVLMDVQMPVMDGLAATRQIREAERSTGARRTPIIALTANAMDHQRAEYLRAGMDALVPKPINLQVLLDTVQTMLVAVEDEEPPFATSPTVRQAPDRAKA